MFIDAEKWLAKYLEDGKPHEIKKLRDDAKRYGLLKSDLTLARKAIGGVVTESEFSAEKECAVWYWRRKNA